MKTLADSDVRIAVAERLKTVRPDAKPLWGRMNAHGMVCHLADSFRLALGERTVSPATGIFQRTVMKWFALWFPAPWPKGVPTRPEVEPGVGGTAPLEFSEDRKELLHILNRFCEPERSFEGILHPIFGHLTQQEWRRWGLLHMDHHLRQFGA
jgi:hypothetical protein